ncbi:head GIN domain-containing protein [Roseateles sp. 22389]|uniref:head GIN domain-containing protein n=1 Tax=Roseateles sp. 22389 TaxID=3453916 RepID=UPI002632263D|nr:head GIN domain-containing protein [uncultured Roseateles sp.]
MTTSSFRASRRLFAVAALGLAAAATVGTAHAWSLSFGSSQRIEGNGEVAAEARDVGAFDAVALSGDFKVFVRSGASDKVEVKTDRNLLAYIETKVVDGSKGRTLEISPKRGYSLNAKGSPVITLDMRQLRGLSIAGSGDIRVEPMKTSNLEASIAGSGDLRMQGLEADHVTLRVAGSGDMQVHGKANALSVSVAGSGDVKTRELVVDEAKVSISGSGDVTVAPTRKLDVRIAGSGDVGYVGSPEISLSNAGSGSVRKLK